MTGPGIGIESARIPDSAPTPERFARLPPAHPPLRCLVGRIGLAVVLVISFLAAPLAAQAEPAGKVYRIGLLSSWLPSDQDPLTPLRQQLRDLGYVEGRNLVVDYRSARKYERLPAMARELVSLKPDL